MTRNVEDRFWSYVNKEAGNGCWVWTGFVAKGYGRFWLNDAGRSIRAHRFSWEMQNGPIPTGLQINHHCDNPSCVRPEHLYAGTARDNMRDMAARGRVNRWQSEKTHCPRGHAYTPENIYAPPSRAGRVRVCRACKDAYNKARPRRMGRSSSVFLKEGK